MSAFLEIDLELRELWNHVRDAGEGDPEALWAVVEQHGLEDKLGGYLRWAFAVGYFARQREMVAKRSPRWKS